MHISLFFDPFSFETSFKFIFHLNFYCKLLKQIYDIRLLVIIITKCVKIFGARTKSNDYGNGIFANPIGGRRLLCLFFQIAVYQNFVANIPAAGTRCEAPSRHPHATQPRGYYFSRA